MTQQPKPADDAKPCPFCGEQGVTVRQGSTYRWIVAECNTCGATCGEQRIPSLTLDPHSLRDIALTAWNQRHEEDA